MMDLQLFFLANGRFFVPEPGYSTKGSL